MAKKTSWGGIAFVVGLVLAILIAVFSATNPPQWAFWVLAILGLIVGLLNVQDKEVQTFLIASVAFLLSFGTLSTILETLAFGWDAVGTFFNLLNVFIAPAAAVVAVIAIIRMMKD